ncbi:MAG: hypothetical protein P1V97_17375 [Planctomycetota bacterium]|nr:hypothetical protein [Planctomycetota bacterium]
MAKCDISIALDKKSNYFAVGERIRGRVLVRVNSDCVCQGLVLRLLWEIGICHDNDTVLRFHLFRGRWKAGQKVAFPFEFEAPAGPLSHEGVLLNLQWRITATADIPMTINIQTSTDIFLTLPPEDDTVVSQGDDDKLRNLGHYVGVRASELNAPEANNPELFPYKEELKTYGPLFVLGLIVLGLIFSFTPWDDGAVAMFMVVALFLVLAGVASATFDAWGAIVRFLSGGKFGSVSLSFGPSEFLAPGLPSELKLEFCPKRAITVKSARATLRCEEIVYKTHAGRHEQRQLKHVVYEGDITICEDQSFEAGDPVELVKSFQLPSETPTTFFVPEAQVMWMLELVIETERGLPWREARPVIVYPSSVVNGLCAAKAPPAKVIKAQSAVSAAPDPLHVALKKLKIAADSGNREQIREALALSQFSFELKVEKVVDTPQDAALPGRDGGQTVLGKPIGLPKETVAVQFDSSFNEETQTLRTGDELVVEGFLQGWNSREKQPLFAAQA